MVRLSAIGDTVHAVPVVASIRRAWPAAHLTWIIQPVPHQLMRGRPDVDDFVLFRRELGMRAFEDFGRRVRGRRYDLVVNLHPCFKAAVVTGMLDAPVRLGHDRRRARDLSWLTTNRRLRPAPPGHVQEEYFEFLSCLGIPVRAEWDFFFTPEEREAQADWFGRDRRPVLAVVTRSSRPEKDWILERWARVLDVAAGDLGFRTVLVGGASDRERGDARALRTLCRFPPEVELRYDLRRLAWLLDGSAVVIAPDTGPLHLAVALATPSIGLYGHTDPARVGPWGRFHDLLVDRHDGADGARPFGRARGRGMQAIREDDVIEKLELALRRYVRDDES